MSTAGVSNNVETAKRLAAERAVDLHVKDGDVVGIGSGSTIVYAVTRLAQRVKDEKLKVRCIPTSFQAKELIVENGLSLSSLDVDPRCNVAIDGADEADKDLTLIKGGGGCLAQEKVVAANSDRFVVIGDDRKKSERLGTGWKYVPIEVLPLAYKPLILTIEKQLGGKANLRMAKAKAGPVVTDNGNFILDWTFDVRRLVDRRGKRIDGDLDMWKMANAELCCLAGVVDTGLFVGMADVAYFGKLDGTVTSLTAR